MNFEEVFRRAEEQIHTEEASRIQAERTENEKREQIERAAKELAQKRADVERAEQEAIDAELQALSSRLEEFGALVFLAEIKQRFWRGVGDVQKAIVPVDSRKPGQLWTAVSLIHSYPRLITKHGTRRYTFGHGIDSYTTTEDYAYQEVEQRSDFIAIGIASAGFYLNTGTNLEPSRVYLGPGGRKTFNDPEELKVAAVRDCLLKQSAGSLPFETELHERERIDLFNQSHEEQRPRTIWDRLLRRN